MTLAHRHEATPAVLLTSAGFHGTLAAVRCYGRSGIPVIVADHTLTGPASWSRFASKRVRCPRQGQSGRFVEWLLQFGRKNPGHVLYPTSDETAWIFALNRHDLAQYFHLYQPGDDAIYSLLNKRQLDRLGRAEGVNVPCTWFPEDERELRQIAREARFPLLLKPVTQILHSTHLKGVIVNDATELFREFEAMTRNAYAPELVNYDPSVGRPLVQEFHSDCRQIYSLSGFIDESGTLLGVRAAIKVLQRPRRTGVGICFEGATVKPELADAVARMARRVGYFGVFEVEFIKSGDQHLLIDFNPRFYGQMGFDIARALPIPLLAYHAAIGDRDGLRRIATRAAQSDHLADHVYCHRMEMELFIRAQRLSGALSDEEAQSWRSWYATNRDRAVDAVVDRSDWRPIVSEITRTVVGNLRHPRGFLRSMLLRSLLLSLTPCLGGV